MPRLTLPALAALFAGIAAWPVPAPAQSSADDPLLRGTSRGYLGLGLGRSRFDPDCTAGLPCESGNAGYKLFAGTINNEVVGAEIGFLDLGRIDIAGGRQRAHGVNISLIGLLPFNAAFSGFGKIGATFGRTDTSSSAPGVQNGAGRGTGLSFGVGLGYRLTPQFEVTAEYERHRFDFVAGQQTLGFASVGLRLTY